MPDEERAGVELDRERERLERMRMEGSQHGEEEERRRGGRTPTNGEQEGEGEDTGNILDTVVLPVLDSVRLMSLLCDELY